MPKVNYTSFSESMSYPMLTQEYHDATVERSLITDTVNTPRALKTFKLVSRFTAADALAFRTFFEAHRNAIPFFWYNPFEAAPGTKIGSNWDPTGNTFEGLYTVKFTSSWNEATGVVFTDISFDLQEVA